MRNSIQFLRSFYLTPIKFKFTVSVYILDFFPSSKGPIPAAGKMWHKAQSFPDFLNLNQKYLSDGHITDSEWIHPLGAPGPILDLHIVEALSDLGLFVYDIGAFYHEIDSEGRPYISFWCPEASNPLKLIKKLQERTDILICATKLHPFEAIEGAAEPIFIERILIPDSGLEIQDCQVVQPDDLSNRIEFWAQENMQLLRPCLIDVVAGDFEEMDLVSKLQEAINQCNWSSA